MGKEAQERAKEMVNGEPVWLSTAGFFFNFSILIFFFEAKICHLLFFFLFFILINLGLGVYWLHVRLDRTPKYYTYVPFREPPSQ